jgi:hypothetical protein
MSRSLLDSATTVNTAWPANRQRVKAFPWASVSV